MNGDYQLEDTVYVPFTTRAFATGIPTALVSGEVQIYEDASVTQITAAETLTVSLDSIAGFNMCAVAATAANGFEAGKSYTLILSAGTVGGVSVVGEVVGQFTIEAHPVNWAKVSAPTTAVDLSGTDIQLVDTATTVTNQVTANATAISGDSTTADNLETIYNGNEGFYTAYIGPRGPGVYFDDTAANTNTTNGVDGTIGNPVSSTAAAKSIADSMSLDRIYLLNDSTLTLAATMEDYEFIGIGDVASNTVALASQDVDNAYFENVMISGAQGGAGRLMAHRCALAALTSLEIMAWECAIVNDLTVRDDCYFDKCWSAVAGNGTPTLDINSVANVDISWRHYSGGLQVDNAVATTTMSYETDGQIIVDATCTSLTLTVRGNCSITDNGTTTSLTQDAAVNRTNINAEMKDVIATDTIAELGVGIPAATPTLETAIMLLYMALRNQTQAMTSHTTDALEISNDAGTVIAHKDVTDDASDYVEAKMQSGASS